MFEEGSVNEIADFQLDDLARRLIDEIGLGNGDDAVTQTEQLEDFKMFAGLRHDGIVGGNHQDGEIDASGAGEHVLDETFVSRHIDDAEMKRRQVKTCETDVNRDTASFLFRQTVTVDAGKGLDERGLAVIDVAGGAEDQIAGHGWLPVAARA